jgi:hypothetical protein
MRSAALFAAGTSGAATASRMRAVEAMRER